MFDEADMHGMQALAYRTLAEHDPAAATTAQRHAKEALHLRENGRQRSQIFDWLSLASACFIADDPEQADRYARLALVSMGANSSHRTWDRCARCTGSPPSTPATRRSTNCVRRSNSPSPRARSGRSAGAPPHRHEHSLPVCTVKGFRPGRSRADCEPISVRSMSRSWR